MTAGMIGFSVIMMADTMKWIIEKICDGLMVMMRDEGVKQPNGYGQH